MSAMRIASARSRGVGLDGESLDNNQSPYAISLRQKASADRRLGGHSFAQDAISGGLPPDARRAKGGGR